MYSVAYRVRLRAHLTTERAISEVNNEITIRKLQAARRIAREPSEILAPSLRDLDPVQA
jgi:hypothetical protein